MSDSFGPLAPLIDASEVYPVLESSIRAARKHVYVAFYTWNDDGTGRYWRDILVDTAQRGVRVRLLVDGLGSRTAVRRKMFQPIEEAGGEVAVFLPLTLTHPRSGYPLEGCVPAEPFSVSPVDTRLPSKQSLNTQAMPQKIPGVRELAPEYLVTN